ncbi:MAG: hypothetical protein RL653_3087, partial [Pseudomonadota bacterium]
MSAPRPVSSAALFALCTLLSACGPDGCGGTAPTPDAGAEDAGAPDAGPSPHCEVDLSRFTGGSGAGARAVRIGSASQLIGGPNAQGRVGDFLLENDRARFVVQAEDRTIGPQPYGGTVLDADVQRDGGAGNDQMGELGLLYNFGRTVDPTVFEILRDGSTGGPVVLAATGEDAPNDYLSIRNQLRNQLGSVPRADPYVALPLTLTNYFILAPGEQRLRFVTAFCNRSSSDVLLGVGDLADPGYGLEFFNGQACTDGFGYGGTCQGIDRMSWYGYLGTGVAWGYAPWKSNTPTQPEPTNTVLTVAGVTGSFLSSPGVTGLAEWFSDAAPRPQGSLVVPAGGRRHVVRDVWVGRDLGELASLVATSRAAVTGAGVGQVSGVVRSGGQPVAGARVSFKEAEGHAGVFVTDAAGRYAGTLPARSYDVAAWAQGRTPSSSQPLLLAAGASATLDLELPPTRTLTVRVKDAADGSPLPARVTVLCRGGACPTPRSELNRFTDAVGDPLLDSMQGLAWVPPAGTVSVQLPPAEYEVLVSRGPEYSLFPQDFRTSGGAVVDLRTADGTLEAKLYRVVDTSGWTSADFHVHAVNGPDSAVTNRDRVLTFLGDGVDVLVATDHDFVTDYAPEVAALGAGGLIATVVGEEVSTMDFGHYNLFPLAVKPGSLNGGALDWAGGRGPTLTPRQLFQAGRDMGARTVHLNHPRGSLGAFTHLRVDTDTLATHADPRDFNMAPPADTTEGDSRLFDGTFNAIELLNSGEDGFNLAVARGRFNDWFTLLSRGLRVTATGVSDTHGKNVASGWRTWVKLDSESPAALDPLALSASLNAQQALASNGPFVKVSAHRLRASTGQVTSVEAFPGGTVPAGTDDVEVTVDVQVPEYLDVSRIELFLHRPEDDEQCPRDPSSPRAGTARVACDGVENLVWPASGVAAALDVAPAPSELEIVATVAGESYRRWHVVRKIRLPAPATDNWIVAMVYGTKSLFPLLYRATAEGSATFVVTPFALTNPIYVDADG